MKKRNLILGAAASAVIIAVMNKLCLRLIRQMLFTDIKNVS